MLGNRGHSYAILPSAARTAQQLALGAGNFDGFMDDLVTGNIGGLVCGRCGMSLQEIMAANVLCIETSPLSSTVCLERKQIIRNLIACDLAGTRPEVHFDQLQELNDTLSAPPWRKELILTMRAATAARLQALILSTDGRLPVLGMGMH